MRRYSILGGISAAALLMGSVCMAAPNDQGGGVDRKKAISDALEKLDVERDDDWTKSGLPDVDRVSDLSGVKTTRGELNEVAAGFERESLRSKSGSGADDGAEDGERVDPGGGGSQRLTAEEVTTGRREPRDYMASEAGREIKSTQPIAGAEGGGVSSKELFDAIDRIMAAASHPKFRRNQVLQQIRTTWASQGAEAKRMQEGVDLRNESRAARTEKRRAERPETVDA